MKIEKRFDNISDTNDKEVCLFKLSDLRRYIANLKRYLEDEESKLTVAQCQSISVEIEAWIGFFRMTDKLNLTTSK